MSRRWIYSIVLFVSFPCLLQAQTAGGKGQPPTTQIVAISGTVRDRAGNAALTHARVLLESVHFGTTAETSTDSSGRFVFNGIGHGIYFVRVKVSGYAGTDDGTRSCDPAACRRVDLTVSTNDFVYFLMDRLASEAPNVPPEGAAGTLDAQDAGVPERAQREYTAAVKALQRHRVADAISNLQKAISDYPNYAAAHFRLGTTYADEHRWADATRELKQATEINPKVSQAQLALGSVYLEQQDFASAEAPLRKCLQLDPQSPFAHFGLARTELARNHLDEAEAEARRTLELKPDFAEVYVILGNVYLRRKEPNAARKAYEQYLQLEPRGPMASETRNVVAQLERVARRTQ